VAAFAGRVRDARHRQGARGSGRVALGRERLRPSSDAVGQLVKWLLLAVRPGVRAIVRLIDARTVWVLVGVVLASAVLGGSFLGSVVFYVGVGLVLAVEAPARWFRLGLPS
jgi:hypothetical protein